MKNIIKYLLASFWVFPIFGNAQFTLPVFPGESGAILLTSVVNAFKPQTVRDYGEARDILYGQIYLENDSVHGIYSDHAVYLAPGQDPSTFVFQNGTPNGINAEHSYPQSKGADEQNGNPHSDMHHIFPSRVAVNEARGSFPFAEIPDNQTAEWFWKSQTLNGIPNSNKDLYSEGRVGAFEPRESVKGNIARAIFYFYTMYKAEADAADPNFFEIQRATLCDWHFADPIDSLEWERTWKIAAYQDGKANPFILDCTVAARTYCTQTQGDCPMFPISNTSLPLGEISPISVFPNPNTGNFKVKSTKPVVAWFFYDLQGKMLQNARFDAKNDVFDVKIENAVVGNYYLFLETERGFERVLVSIGE